jgi:hypothetical protein
MTDGDTLKQLLARSAISYTRTNQMVQNQTERAVVLFELYPDIQKKLMI